MDTSTMSPLLLTGIGALVLLQLSLQVAALVQLSRTPADRVTLEGRKWLWVLIIVLGELVGAIAWFVAGRRPAPVDVSSTPSVSGGSAAADTLYGPEDERE